MIKLFFVTDIHGSNVCYRKFLNALPIYGVDVAVLLGDLTGKVLVPLVDKGGDQWECTVMGQYREINGQEELADIKKTVENAGYYWVHQTRAEFDETRGDPAKIDALFKSLVFAARPGVARPRRRASRGQAVPDVHGAGQRRLVRHRRHDRQRQARAPVRRARGRDRPSRDGHLVGLQPHSVADAARDERGRPREEAPRAGREGQEPGDGDLQLPRAALRVLARPVPQARREPHDGRRREDPRRQHRRQDASSRSTSRCSACTATSTSHVARRRPAGRCSSTPAASTPRASSRASSSCSTRRR